jgi:nitrite reductase/ring-hydroxylating ferredoxin subunit
MSTRFIRVARAADIPPGTGRHVEVGDHVLAVFHHGGQFFVLDGTCPHQGGPLGEGFLDPDGVVTCPWHAWQFDITTGECPDSPRLCVGRYEVDVRDGEVFAALPADAAR